MEQHRRVTHQEEVGILNQAPILIYPPKRGGNPLYERDLARLNEGVYLNDHLVNVMLAWAKLSCMNEEYGQQVQLCDSYMYAQLTKGFPARQHRDNQDKLEENFARVNNFRRTKGPGDKPVTFVPVCEDFHWYLVVLVGNRAMRTATTYVVDSLATCPRIHAGEVVAKFIQYSWSSEVLVEVVPISVAQQGNLYDCGLHLIHNAKRWMEFLNRGGNTDLNSLKAYLDQPPCPTTREEVRRVIMQLVADRSVANNDTTMKVVEAEGPSHPTPPEEPVEEVQNFVVIPARHHWVPDASTVVENAIEDDWVLHQEQADIIAHLIQESRRASQNRRQVRFKRTIMGTILSFRLNKGFMRVVRLAEVPL